MQENVINSALPLSIIPTGLNGLDTILGGGIIAGSLIVVVGQPGTGKTTLLQQLCFTWSGQPTRTPPQTQPQPLKPPAASASTETDVEVDPGPNGLEKNEVSEANPVSSTSHPMTETAQPKVEGHDPQPTPPSQFSKALYFSTLSEPHDKVIAHVSSFAFFDPAKLNNRVVFLSLMSIMEQADPLKIASFVVSNARRQGANLVVIDGLGALFEAFGSVQATRYFFNLLSTQLNVLGISAIMSLEQNLASVTDSDLNSLLAGVDGIIVLSTREQGAGEFHQLEIPKLRGMRRLEGRHSYSFSGEGLIIYPRLEAVALPPDPDEVADQEAELKEWLSQEELPPDPNLIRLGFGLPELEKMLGRGLPLYSSTFVAGSPGVGKTLLGLHYLMAGVEKGEVGLYIGFYEKADRLVDKANRFNLDLKGAILRGQLKLLTFSPVELNPDKLGTLISHSVETYGVQRVVIDGILELEIACRPEGRSRNYTSALDRYFKERNISCLYTYTISTVN